jgi:adenylosuccinate lyase
VERIILPDASILTHYMLVTCRRLIEGLVVDADRMLANFELSYGLVFSQPVLLALVADGMARDDAYRIVQQAAQRSWAERRPFRQILEEDPDVTLKPDSLDEAFDLGRALRHAHRTIDALDELQ